MSWCLFCNQRNYKRRLIVHITYQEFTKIMLLVISKLPIVIFLRLEVGSMKPCVYRGGVLGSTRYRLSALAPGHRQHPTSLQRHTLMPIMLQIRTNNGYVFSWWAIMQKTLSNLEQHSKWWPTRAVCSKHVEAWLLIAGRVSKLSLPQTAHTRHTDWLRFMMFILIYFHFIVSWKRIK